MTLKEAIFSLRWQEVEVGWILLDCVYGIVSNLILILVILLTATIFIETAKYAGNLSGHFLRRLTAEYKKPRWLEYGLALPADHNMPSFLTKLGYLFGGTIIIIFSYALALLEVNLLMVNEGTYASPLINDTGVAAATIRHYLMYSGPILVILNCYAGLAVMISALGGRWFRTLSKLLFTLALALALFAAFFHMVVGESL